MQENIFMKTKVFHRVLPTNDLIIRCALREALKKRHAHDKELRIIEELGLRHGSVRIDVAVINGIMHGYEIKSDRDTLERLPEQMTEFSAVFDHMTLVVGKQHLYRAIHMVPDWWGITIAKIDTRGRVIFHTIRQPGDNNQQDKISIARLLWREEAQQILEELDQASGVRSKSREVIYKRLAEVLEVGVLKERVRKTLLIPRKNWRFGLTLISDGG
jgi:hypothetical protein